MQLVNEVFALVEQSAKVLFHFFGMFPIFVGDRGPSNRRNLSELLMTSWSYVWILYIAIHISIVVAYRDLVFSQDSVGKWNDILKFCAVAFAFITIIVESLINAEKFKKLFRNLQKFNLQCSPLGVKISENQKRTTKAFAKKVLMIEILHAFCILAYWKLVDSRQWMIFWFANIFPSLYCHVRHLQYILCLHLIHSKVSLLQTELEKIVAISGMAFFSSDQKLYKMSLDHLQLLKSAHEILWKATFTVNDW